MKTFFIFLSILIASVGYAQEPLGKLVGTQEIWTPSATDGKLHFKIYQTYSDIGEKRLIYELEEGHHVFPSSHLVVLFGQDFDYDGKIDAWFPATSDGFGEIIYQTSRDPQGWDVAKEILVTKSKVTERSVFELAYRNFLFVFSGIGVFNGSKERRDEHNSIVIREQLELLTAEARFQLTGPHSLEERNSFYGTDPSIDVSKINCQDPQQVIPLGLADRWNCQLKKINQAYWNSVLQYLKDVMTDIVPFAISAKWLKSVLPGFVTRAGERLSSAILSKVMGPIFKDVETSVKFKVLKIPATNPIKVIAMQTPSSSGFVFSRRVASRVRILSVEGHTKIMVAGRYVGRVAQAGNPAKKYTSIMVAGNSLGVLAAHRNAVSDPNPLKVVRNIVTNPDIMYSLLFNVWDGLIQNKIHGYYGKLGKKGTGFLVSGFYSLVDSSLLGTGYEVITGESKGDLQKIIDTSYQSVFGNIVSKADDFVEHYFEGLARSGSTRWRMVGVTLQIVNQTACFYGYESYNHYIRQLEYKIQTARAHGISEEEVKSNELKRLIESGAATAVAVPVLVPVN